MILSSYQAKKILGAIILGKDKVTVSLDLGKTVSELTLKDKRIIFPDNQAISHDDIKKIIKKDSACFLIRDSSIVPVQLFSEETNKFYKLYPTASWPSLEISGIRMHVTKAFSPKEDTEKKISFIMPCTGNILDTCTGLGYTAIMASKAADEIYTYEIDENVTEIERYNPYSEELFTSKKIKRINGDIFIEIKKHKSKFFDGVIHDPPRQALATLLYSEDFYKELYRVMKPGARLYHYTGDPGSRNRGLDIRQGIIKRLSRCKFLEINRVFNGVSAKK